MIIPTHIQAIIIRRFVQHLEDSKSSNNFDLSEILQVEQDYKQDLEEESFR